jgi:hypothetical protein
MTDIGLEDFSFVLLSQLINLFDALGKEINWSPALRCLELAIKNLRLSGFDTKECQAIESEMEAWRRGFRPQDREHPLGSMQHIVIALGFNALYIVYGLA